MTTSGGVNQGFHGANQFAFGCETIQVTATPIIQTINQYARNAVTLATTSAVCRTAFVPVVRVNIQKTECVNNVQQIQTPCLAVLV